MGAVERAQFLAKPDKKEEAVGDLPSDREQKLAHGFVDPTLEEILPGLADPDRPGCVVTEAAEAVRELVSGLDASDTLLQMEEQPGVDAYARLQAAERLFGLLASEKDFSALTEEILAILVATVNGQAGSILELDHSKEEFFFRASIGGGDPERLRSFRVPCYQGIVGHVAESRQALMLGQDEIDAKQLRAISMSTGFETYGCLAAPILVANQLFGVVEVFNKVGGAFDQNDLKALEEATRMAAKLLEVRFLLAELARRVR